MRKLKELLDGVEVEWKNFGEVAKIQRGASPRPIEKFITEDKNGVPWIRIGDTSPNSKYVSNTKQKITLEGANKSRILKKGDFIISNSMSFGRPYILDIDGAIHDGWASISEFGDKLYSDYLYHYLACENVQNFWLSKINSGSVSNLNADIIKSLHIPIPPFEVQKEIASILDTFTERTETLINELTTELEARKKQYNYYREKLLSFEDGQNSCLNQDLQDSQNFQDKVEWKTFGEVFDLKAGHHISASNIMNVANLEYQFPCFGGNGIRGYVKTKSHEGNHLLIGRQGALCGNVQRFNGEFYATEHAVVVTSYGEMNIDFAFHLLTLMNLNQYASKSAQPGLAVGNLERLKIPIPSKEEQERIVVILDKLDSLTTSISEALPKEIALRKKQYEYYRDRLLTFK